MTAVLALQRLGMQSKKGFAGLSLDSLSTSVGGEAPDDGIPFLTALHSDPQLSEKVSVYCRSVSDPL